MHLFVITGAPGSGKTPIVQELRRLGFVGVDEPARQTIAERRAAGGQGIHRTDPQLFCDSMLARAISDYQRMSGASAPVFFDRGIPDMVGYFELFGLATSQAAAAASQYRYADPVFVLPSWRQIYVTDDERTMTFEAAEAFGERVRRVYADLGYVIVDVPRDSIPSRARFITDCVKRLSVAPSADAG